MGIEVLRRAARKRKAVFTFFCALLVILLGGWTAFGIASFLSSLRDGQKTAEESLARKNTELVHYFRLLDYTAYIIMFSNWVQQFMVLDRAVNHAEHQLRQRDAAHFLSSLESISGNVSFVLISKDTMVQSSNTIHSNPRYDITSEPWYSELLSSKKHYVFGASNLFTTIPERYSLTIYYLVTSIYNFEPLGFLAINVSGKRLEELLTDDVVAFTLVDTAGENVVSTGTNHETVIAAHTLPTARDSFFNRHFTAEGAVPLPALEERWRLSVTQQVSLNPFSPFGYFSLFFLLLFPAAALFIAAILVTFVRQNREVEKLRHDAEMESLLQKINPHFLYNTLEMVNALILTKRTQAAVAVCETLGSIYHYNLATDTWTPLSSEIDYIRQYIELLTYSKPDLKAVWTIDASALSIIIPRLILQPLVENAYLHGLRTKTEGACISISVKVVDDERRAVLITIADNGEGITKEHYQTLMERMGARKNSSNSRRFYRDDDDAVPSHIGLANVYGRLCLEYGDNFTFDITSAPSSGTSVHLRLPALRKEK